MTRKLQQLVEQTPEEQLETIIPRYGETKDESDKLAKLVKVDNNKIKELMLELEESQFETGGYIAKMSTQKRESFNEDLLLDILKKLKMKTGIVKKKEYVDYDALENAIYHGHINAADLQPAQEIKEIVVLKVSKVKENK